MFNAILVTQNEQTIQSKLTQINEVRLPDGDVELDILASSVNYKDALAITRGVPVIRSFPMIPGIDLAGRVTRSDSDKFRTGDLVLLNGFGLGEQHWGGLAEKASVNSDWLIHLPQGFTPVEAMAIGTAGYTAMLSIIALEQHGIQCADGDILVTGASGGVGSFAIRLLSKLGYRVVAATGRLSEAEYLKKLGAAEVMDRNELSSPGKPLQKERWAGVIDCVGSHTLVNACAMTQYGGAVTACGLAQGMEFPATVAPFILRGISLYGIDSVMKPLSVRKQAWQRLSELLSSQDMVGIYQTISLEQVIACAQDLLEGKVRGRVVVDMSAS